MKVYVEGAAIIKLGVKAGAVALRVLSLTVSLPLNGTLTLFFTLTEDAFSMVK